MRKIFQLSIWDSRFKIKTIFRNCWTFQLSIWDSWSFLRAESWRRKSLSTLYMRFIFNCVEIELLEYLSFNSLYEILAYAPLNSQGGLLDLSTLYMRFASSYNSKNQHQRYFKLSTLYMRFEDEVVTIDEVNRVVFQLSIWDS